MTQTDDVVSQRHYVTLAYKGFYVHDKPATNSRVVCRHGHCCAGNPSDQRLTSNELAAQRRRNTLPRSVRYTTVRVQILITDPCYP